VAKKTARKKTTDRKKTRPRATTADDLLGEIRDLIRTSADHLERFRKRYGRQLREKPV
jgi:hypothetical protein